MASYLTSSSLMRVSLRTAQVSRFNVARSITTAVEGESSKSSNSNSSSSTTSKILSESQNSVEIIRNAPATHFKITLRRSAISLGDKIKGTLKALGIHRRFQTVYFPHSPEVAGKILRVKELVEVENVPTHMVMTKQQQRQARKAPRGYKVVDTRVGKFMNV
ncbi:hypothetical protein D9613_008153 [Agrocybe pediades]|uniref:Large ribosomal subunit protein uL30m n=1 Tax=Agrocybe pediades TaxID=84607 RepID=A0A8H4QP65_9AGAR|nr:hypothetical protein D9613_008153 [Agrocybe pediades]